jgi:hypothetical protein
MIFTKRTLVIVFIVLGILVINTQSFAQNFALERARDAAGVPAPNTPNAPQGVSPEDFARFSQGQRVLTGDTTQANMPEVKLITVVEGELVISAKSGQILQRPERKMVPETMKDQYYDDGTHGDEVAGDGIYSNVTVRKDVISKDEYKQRIIIETFVGRIARDNPVDFYRVYAATDSYHPEIPSYDYWRTRKKEFIDDYRLRALVSYKDEKGNYYPVYEPPKPAVQATAMGQMGGQGGMRGGMGPRVIGAPGSSPDNGDLGMTRSSYFGERNQVK